MRRRTVLQLLAGAALAPAHRAAAQTADRTFRLASLTAIGPLPGSYGTTLTRALAELGYTIGRNLEFKGASPKDLPFERPTRYLFVVNLKTAKATGLELPPDLVALADEVIE